MSSAIYFSYQFCDLISLHNNQRLVRDLGPIARFPDFFDRWSMSRESALYISLFATLIIRSSFIVHSSFSKIKREKKEEKMTDTSLESTLGELTQFFEPSDDLLLIQGVVELRKVLVQGFKEKDEQQQQYIDELTTTIAEAEEVAQMREQPLKERQVAADCLSKEIELTRKSADSLSKEKLKFRQDIDNMDQAAAIIRCNRQKLEVAPSAAESLPKVKYLLSLYAMLSNIEWDYESDHCKGIISHPDSIKEFDFVSSPSASSSSSSSSPWSQFDMANQLWELIAN